jgi:hypothetical protein
MSDSDLTKAPSRHPHLGCSPGVKTETATLLEQLKQLGVTISEREFVDEIVHRGADAHAKALYFQHLGHNVVVQVRLKNVQPDGSVKYLDFVPESGKELPQNPIGTAKFVQIKCSTATVPASAADPNAATSATASAHPNPHPKECATAPKKGPANTKSDSPELF